ncbi:MAG: sulfite oxidase [Pseudomonadota bacterium]
MSYPINRRRFLVTTAAAGTAAATVQLAPGQAAAQDGELPDFASFKTPDDVMVWTGNTIETERSAQGGSITGLSSLFVRNNLPAPPQSITDDPEAWVIEVDGVANPGSMTLGDLKRLGVITVSSVLQCSGNGRAFFGHETSGTHWSVGAAGNVVWTGVPLSAVIAAMGGPADGANFITGTGGEELPAGLDPNTIMVERSIPIGALDQAMIAFEVNGEPLPVAHGGPARMVTPGYFGVNNVKYVKKIALTAEESQAKIQQSGYRVREVGAGGAPDQPSMYEMVVKSWITTPLVDAKSGKILIEGVAMGGVSTVTGVEVSTDGGGTWQAADFTGPDMGPFSWRPFALIADMPAGQYELASRATNDAGDTQPEDFPPNHRGYGHNGWRDHAVLVTVV